MEEFITGTGQKILVHNKKNCKGRHCCIHNPSDHHMKDWPLHWRDDRNLMERICPHGIGHPDPDDLNFRKFQLERRGLAKEEIDKIIRIERIHGCDGCCHTPEFIEKKEFEIK
jgi:hypothetical protein